MHPQQRRAQTVRHHSRPSLAHNGANEHGMINEGSGPEATLESYLRGEIRDKDSEIDQLRSQIGRLQDELKARPPRDYVDNLKSEMASLEIIIEGMQRENVKALEQQNMMRKRQKLLEDELAKWVGPNWEQNLQIQPFPPDPEPEERGLNAASSSTRAPLAGPTPPKEDMHTHLEQIRLLILGMEKRLSSREDALNQVIARAEGESQRFEELGQGASAVRIRKA
ncbi:hypothetical protein K488DRAFT_56224 [Vararia minispora EC-137]|uniref:Uncharacterized protein n=1 Tax=Vararia minispora EC-137 TaxID=1314806 RepID=A0ACB8QCW2_9AGAM|nr:hypothetical protein K488DRAFT_56224 [Vararia minispora EC-137]